jgi:hypothetical protein
MRMVVVLCSDTFAGGIGSHITHSELQALFDVIGTPSWADAQAVTTPAWRHYLQVCLQHVMCTAGQQHC